MTRTCHAACCYWWGWESWWNMDIVGIISPSFPSLGDWRTWSQTRLFQAVSITHRRREERRVSLQNQHISRQMSQLQRAPAGGNALTYVALMPHFQEVIFDRTNPSLEPQGVTLQVHRGSDAAEGWRYWWDCCIEPRPGATRSSLLKESMIMCSSAWPPRREPKP